VRSGAQRLSDYREELTWGDLAAMLIAIRAIQIPQVVDPLFDYAERDKADTTTEYGGVIALDRKDRFEIREFQPVMRKHDQTFIASQAMLDAAYTSIFHFHMHVQNYRNDRFAGPGFGDLNYADNTRANCLVFTFMNEDTLNVDFYRHDRVVIDLGVIRRPSKTASLHLQQQWQQLHASGSRMLATIFGASESAAGAFGRAWRSRWSIFMKPHRYCQLSEPGASSCRRIFDVQVA